jgi:hypothetical protein
MPVLNVSPQYSRLLLLHSLYLCIPPSIIIVPLNTVHLIFLQVKINGITNFIGCAFILVSGVDENNSV